MFAEIHNNMNDLVPAAFDKRKDMLVVLESTTYPGTTEELIKPILENTSGLICGKDFYLAFSG